MKDENEILELLINEGCPSIAYRVRTEIRQEHLLHKEHIDYQNRIYASPKVQEILSWQNQDGYFGTRLHTAPSKSKIWPHEGCVRFLLEKGLNNKHVEKALKVMLQPGWGKECENSRAASVIKYEMIRASLFAQAGYHEYDFVTEWVNDGLQSFRNIADAESYMDLVYERTDHKLVCKGGKYLPVIYHLRLLAFTDFWKTEENLGMLKVAYEKLYGWLPLPPIYYRCKTHPAAPLGPVSWSVNQSFNERFGFFWLQFYELSARMGMLGGASPFRKHFEELKEVVLKQDECFVEYTKKRNLSYISWSGYSGISLEGDGKTQQQRMLDFMFRVMLIDRFISGGSKF